METFWKPEPREPWRDWRTYSMLIPIVVGALGACIFFALGLAFAEVANIAPRWRKPMILTAAFGVAFGSTFGSIGSGIEVFRKAYKKQATGWDWVSLSISTVTTIAGMIIGVATLLGGTTDWSTNAVIWGSAAVCGLAALDAAGDGIELGGLFGSFEDRKEAWLEERETWRRENGQEVVRDSDQVALKIGQLDREVRILVDQVTYLADRWSWPQANKAQFKTILAGMNGDAPELDRESVILVLAKNQLAPPSDSTLGKWIREAQS